MYTQVCTHEHTCNYAHTCSCMYTQLHVTVQYLCMCAHVRVQVHADVYICDRACEKAQVPISECECTGKNALRYMCVCLYTIVNVYLCLHACSQL
jgi:hypothetical protein